MPKVEVDNIMVRDAHGGISSPITLEITFTALSPLPHPVAFKLLYVGSAFSEDYDQTLEEVELGPIL